MSIARREPPYAGTTVPTETTWAQVEKLLMDYGAEAVRKTRMKDGGTTIEFVLTTDTGGVQQRFACQITSPMIIRKRKGMVKNEWGGTRRGIVTTTDEAAAARLSLWYIKSLLEAASYGLVSVERVFMPFIKFSLPDGRTTTAGEIMERAIQEGKAPTIGGFDHYVPALPEKKAQVIDVQGGVK